MRGKLVLAGLRVLDSTGSWRAHSHHLPDDYGAEMIKIAAPRDDLAETHWPFQSVSGAVLSAVRLANTV